MPSVEAGGVAGERIGRYALLRPLARGGMAQLFLARADGIEGFRKIVAVKRIRAEFAGDPEFIRMFLDEARLAATLEHPNIATVYDIGEDGDELFFAMEYVHGEDIRTILRAARSSELGLPLGPALTMAVGVCAGLHHAHSRIGYDGEPLGLVHRDVSPTNVIVSYDGAVKVVDFGIAKARASGHVTREGTRKGKAGYMSPEQCRGEPVDARSDIFAIGILLYELCTMQRPFRGDDDLAIMHQIVSGEFVPPSAVVPSCPRELEDIVMRCLAPDPADRWSSAEALQLALEAFAREEKLPLSAAGLSHYVRALLGDKPCPWEAIPGIGPVERRADGTFVCTEELPATSARPMPAMPVRSRAWRRAVIPSVAAGGVLALVVGLASARWQEANDTAAPMIEAPSPAVERSPSATEPSPRRPASVEPVMPVRPPVDVDVDVPTQSPFAAPAKPAAVDGPRKPKKRPRGGDAPVTQPPAATSPSEPAARPPSSPATSRPSDALWPLGRPDDQKG